MGLVELYPLSAGVDDGAASTHGLSGRAGEWEREWVDGSGDNGTRRVRGKAYFQLVSLVLVAEKVGTTERDVVSKPRGVTIDVVSVCMRMGSSVFPACHRWPCELGAVKRGS